jgi:hypothetical protein
MHLMDTATDTEIMPGSVLRPVEPPRIPWKLESLHTSREGVPMVHASRHTRNGRIHHVFHPHAFGLEVVVDVTIGRMEHARNAIHVAYRKTCDCFPSRSSSTSTLPTDSLSTSAWVGTEHAVRAGSRFETAPCLDGSCSAPLPYSEWRDHVFSLRPR